MPFDAGDCAFGCCAIDGSTYCHQWLRTRLCGYGDRCAFLHSVPPWMDQYPRSHWRKKHRRDESPSSSQPASSSQSAAPSQWELPSLKRTCTEAMAMMQKPKHEKINETNATLDDLETFAMYSQADEKADEKAEEKAAPKKRPSKQRPKITHVINTADTPCLDPPSPEPQKMSRKMHVFVYGPNSGNKMSLGPEFGHAPYMHMCIEICFLFVFCSPRIR